MDSNLNVYYIPGFVGLFIATSKIYAFKEIMNNQVISVSSGMECETIFVLSE